MGFVFTAAHVSKIDKPPIKNIIHTSKLEVLTPENILFLKSIPGFKLRGKNE